LIGLLACLEGELMAEEGDDVPDWAKRFTNRLSRDGLSPQTQTVVRCDRV